MLYNDIKLPVYVKDMYNYSKGIFIPLLSNYDADFWKDYTANYMKYDKLFTRLYKSFRYFNQDDEQTTEEITLDFQDEVYNHLLINHKKYEELYRVQVLPSEDYNILSNYSIKETLDKTTSSNGTDTLGARQDTDKITDTEDIGERSDTESNTRNVIEGARSDSEGKDTTITEGSRSDSNSGNNKIIEGERTDDTTIQHIDNHQGRDDTTENTIAGFNDTYADADKTTYSKGGELVTVNGTTKFVKGEQINTGEESGTFNKGSQVNTEVQTNTYGKGEQKNTETNEVNKTMGAQQNMDVKDSIFNKGEQVNTESDSGKEDYTLTREGIQDMASADLINKHLKLWTRYEFYSYIFKEICAELLMI